MLLGGTYVVSPGAPSSLLLLVAMPGAPSCFFVTSMYKA